MKIPELTLIFRCEHSQIITQTMKVKYHCSPQAYQEYFQNGAGKNYPVFKGYYTQRGYGIGSLLINAMRGVIPIFTKKILPKAVPLIKRGTQSLAKKL